MSRKISKTKGAGLIELLIACGVLVIVGLGALLVYRDSLTGSKVSEEITEASAAQLELFAAFSSEDICRLNLENKNPATPLNLNSILGASSVPILQVGQVYSKRLRVLPFPAGIRLEPAQNPAQRPGIDGRGRVDLVVNFSVESSPNREQGFRFPVMVQTGPTGLIVTCSSQGANRTDCKHVRRASSGERADVDCPAGYTIVGGGLSDTDFTKGSFYSYPVKPNLGAGTGGTSSTQSISFSPTGSYASFHPAAGGSSAGISNITVEGELRFTIPGSAVTQNYDQIVLKVKGQTGAETYKAKIGTGPYTGSQPTTTSFEEHSQIYPITAGTGIQLGVYFENPAPGRALIVDSVSFYTLSLPTASDWGGWRCYSDDGGGTLTCYAVCCK